ncbi:MAG TPA: putative nucleotidyltransferase substrate binding domain-containing protein [Solirubrobacteraceae bacterium]|nr:putative nucleotidyltransferase substrate binding domain-containing protein [Solirubrobacteraceae bacterium]
MHDIAEFLSRHEPFRDLDEPGLDAIAQRTEVEFFPAGTVIFDQGASAREHVRMIRRGAVELLDGTQILDGLGEGELFGHPSMLTGLPTEFAARAGEDTLVYRIEADAIIPLLTRPAVVRYLAREIRHREGLRSAGSPAVAARMATRHVATMVDRRCIVCDPETPVGETARRMVDADVSCAVVRLAEGYGIVTDHDLRARVIAAGRSFDVPVREVMSAPALTADPEVTVGDAALTMIERGVRHIPVVRSGGEVIGVLRDVDLLATETRTPFTLRREIAAAGTPAEVTAVAARLPTVLIALHDAETSALQMSRVHSAIADALITRLLELISADTPAPMWIALGSHGRRELAPGSDLDSAVTWPADVTADEEQSLRDIARHTVEALGTPGVEPDPHGATASSQLFARSIESWRQAVRRWAADPSADKVPIVLSALLDGRPVGPGPAWSEAILAEMTNPSARLELERWLRRLALSHRLPTGFVRSRVLDPSGSRRHVDLKRDGLQPIVDLGRYAGFAAGAGLLSTPARLRAGAAAGVLSDADARLLIEAHELFSDLRVSHHLSLLREGRAPKDSVDPTELSALTRSYMKDAFRLVAGVQRRMTDGLRVR